MSREQKAGRGWELNLAVDHLRDAAGEDRRVTLSPGTAKALLPVLEGRSELVTALRNLWREAEACPSCCNTDAVGEAFDVLSRSILNRDPTP